MQALLDTIATMDMPQDARRLFHGRGGRYPGCEQWTLDAYPPVWVVTSFMPVSDSELATLQTALQARWEQIAPGQPLNWVFQQRLEGRAETRLMAGSVPEPHEVTEAGAQYWVHVHLLAHPHPNGLRAPKVLNLFAYTCAFSVVALQAGARQVVNVDMSSGAIAIGQQNHRLNGLDTGASFLAHDIFTTWGKINRAGPYDLIIVDPPTHQKGSFVATKDYARLMRRLPDLLAPEGRALLCLNTPTLGLASLQDQMRDLAPSLAFEQRVANPAVFADTNEDRSLKVLVYRAAAAAPSTTTVDDAKPA